MIQHLVVGTLQVLPCAQDKYLTPPSSPGAQQQQRLPSLLTFISKLVRYTNVYTETLVSTLVYLNRLRTRLPKDAQGLACTRHRIFLACLILSSKYHNDSSPKNVHWSKYTEKLFNTADVNLMERQLLYLLDWDLRITQTELVNAWKIFIDPIKLDLKRLSRSREFLERQHLKEVKRQKLQRQQRVVSKSPVQEPPFLHSRANSTCSDSTSSSESEDAEDLLKSNLNTSLQQLPSLDMMNSKLAALNEERELDQLLRQYELRY